MNDATERARLRMAALSRWDSDGGSGSARRPAPTSSVDSSGDAAATPAEWVHLRIRVIALENLVIALLAQAPHAQLALAREMADYISPRPGCTPHPSTLRAARGMRSLVDRAAPFRASSSA